ncbi:MAG: DUF87 domain-containing protein, partial [Acidobacteriota bacterium]
ADLTPLLAEKHFIELGETDTGVPIRIPAHRNTLLITGGSGSGKSTLTGVLIERLVENDRTVCVIDPEGDYAPLADLDTVIVMGGGNDKPLPSQDELAQIIRKPATNLVLNLHALTLPEKTAYVASTLATLEVARAECGRPHWLVIDEVHHIFPAEGSVAEDNLPKNYEGLCLITFDAKLAAKPVLRLVKRIASRTVEALSKAVYTVLTARQEKLSYQSSLNYQKLPPISEEQAAIVVLPDNQHEKVSINYFHPAQRRTTHRRHIRKYATGELPVDRSFYFRGAQNKLNLRAANLMRFAELAAGIDDETWLFHLNRGDYSNWLRHNIKNDELANEVAQVEHSSTDKLVSAQESRHAVIEAINRRYTA